MTQEQDSGEWPSREVERSHDGQRELTTMVSSSECGERITDISREGQGETR